MVMYIITSKLNSTFGMIGKATGVKMTAIVLGKNSSLNENLLLLNFLSHFFHLVPCIWEF